MILIRMLLIYPLLFSDYYFSYKFYGIILDNRTAGISSARESQVQVL
jgi:hypothetical protein